MNTLLVGQHSKQRELIRQVLEDRGHEVSTRPTREAAWKAYLRTYPSLVVCMLSRQEMLQFCRQIRQDSKGHLVTVLAVVTPAEDGLRKVAKAGADEFILLPIEEVELVHSRVALAELRAAKKQEGHEERINERQERLAGAFSLAPVALTILTLTESRFVDVNKRFSELTGYAWEELDGQTTADLDLFHKREEGSVSSEVVDAKSGYENVQMKLRTKSGKVRDVLSSAQVVSIGETSYLLVFFFDITLQKHRERELLESREEERRRVGHDLQEWLGQMLTGMEMISQSLVRELDQEGSDLALEAENLYEFVKEASEFTRDLTQKVLPVELHDEGLVAALTRLVHTAGRVYNIECEVAFENKVVIPNHTVATTLYEIVQEAIMHAIKRGEARSIKLRLQADKQEVRLWVEDDGDSSPKAWAQEEAAKTLRIMRYHTHILNGSLEIHNANGGTVLSCTLPQQRRKRP